MKAKTMNTLSTVAISLGSFLLGGSFGISLASSNCEKCDAYFMQKHISKALDLMLAGDIDGDDTDIDPEMLAETLAEYERQTKGYNAVILTDKEEIGDSLEEDEDDDDESYSNTIKEISVGDETIEVKQTEYGTEEVGEPYIVSKDSYEYEYEDFAKEDLVYFEDDKILIDDKDEIIDNPDRYIGTEALDNFGEGSEDEDIVYVRNIRYGIDYRIVKEHTSYRENVLGLTEEGDEAYEKALEFLETKKDNFVKKEE